MDSCSLTHLVLSFSLLSFIVSYSTSYSCLIYSFKYYLSSSFKYYLSSWVSHMLDKNFIFLIFNGILVFLAKTSGFMRISNSSLEPNELISSTQNETDEEYHDLNFVLEKKETVVKFEDEPKREETRNVYNVNVEEYALNLATIDNEEEKKAEDDSELLSSEDLKKKFDDFIRMMKEEFKSGTQQQRSGLMYYV